MSPISFYISIFYVNPSLYFRYYSQPMELTEFNPLMLHREARDA